MSSVQNLAKPAIPFPNPMGRLHEMLSIDSLTQRCVSANERAAVATTPQRAFIDGFVASEYSYLRAARATSVTLPFDSIFGTSRHRDENNLVTDFEAKHCHFADMGLVPTLFFMVSGPLLMLPTVLPIAGASAGLQWARYAAECNKIENQGREVIKQPGLTMNDAVTFGFASCMCATAVASQLSAAVGAAPKLALLFGAAVACAPASLHAAYVHANGYSDAPYAAVPESDTLDKLCSLPSADLPGSPWTAMLPTRDVFRQLWSKGFKRQP